MVAAASYPEKPEHSGAPDITSLCKHLIFTFMSFFFPFESGQYKTVQFNYILEI